MNHQIIKNAAEVMAAVYVELPLRTSKERSECFHACARDIKELIETEPADLEDKVNARLEEYKIAMENMN